METQSSLNQRSVLVTGATGVIGRSIADRLLKAGYDLHLHARRSDSWSDLKANFRLNDHQFHAGDLGDESAVETVMRRFLENSKTPYALICNAANLGVAGRLANIDFHQWKKALDANFFHQVLMIQKFIKFFSESGLKGGRIVVMSGAGIGGSKSFDGVSNYVISKAALTFLVDSLAREIEPWGLTINAVAPGAVMSGMTQQAIDAGEERIADYSTDAKKLLKSGGVSPDLAAEIIEWILSDDASEISGRLLSARFDRDRLKTELSTIAKSPDLFRLRRIDDELFSAERKNS